MTKAMLKMLASLLMEGTYMLRKNPPPLFPASALRSVDK